jgi:hypothetical protein
MEGRGGKIKGSSGELIKVGEKEYEVISHEIYYILIDNFHLIDWLYVTLSVCL